MIKFTNIADTYKEDYDSTGPITEEIDEEKRNRRNAALEREINEEIRYKRDLKNFRGIEKRRSNRAYNKEHMGEYFKEFWSRRPWLKTKEEAMKDFKENLDKIIYYKDMERDYYADLEFERYGEAYMDEETAKRFRQYREAHKNDSLETWRY